MDVGNANVDQLYHNLLASRIPGKLMRVMDGQAVQRADVEPAPQRNACDKQSFMAGYRLRWPSRYLPGNYVPSLPED